MILDENLRMALLDGFGELAQQGGLTYTGHVFQTDFLCTGLDELVGDSGVILECVHRRGGDTERTLCRHAGLLGPVDRGDDIAYIVQTVEDAGDVGSLCMLHTIHELAHIIGHGIHAERVETTVEHVGLDACGVERGGKGAHGLIGVFACQQVYLLKGTAIGFYT